ncbi:hypothetical protein ACIA5D_38700 [Actinoplanes sp. NPDC051513]|uniref:hypothetical protein n=1 Tax=Actinoplanes sp. NPDC051513 TaxID=3363908 RepID=UPI0037BD1C6F
MSDAPDRHARTMLPIPDRAAPGLTTYDTKDPETRFPPIEPLRPPAGAPNVLVVPLDDVGFEIAAGDATGVIIAQGTAVTAACTVADSRFTGKIHQVRIDLGDDDHGHAIDPEERLRIAMARQ